MSLPIETNGLIKRYGGKIALNNVTLSIDSRKIIGLIGRNGAGKTSFLKTCAGLLKPSTGEVRIWGEQPFDNLRVLAKLIFIGEETQYDDRLKLKELMELGAIYYPDWDQAFAEKLLKRFELLPALKYKSLSLGMKTQFKAIMGLSSRVPLVLFDEPTLGMDAAARKEFYHVLIRDYSEHPRTFILSSHLPDEVENLVEEVVVLKEGSVVLHKPIERLQEYAVCLHGKQEDIDRLAGKRQMLAREYLSNRISVVVVNDFETPELEQMAAQNVQIRRVSFQDLCIYLTQREEEKHNDEIDI